MTSEIWQVVELNSCWISTTNMFWQSDELDQIERCFQNMPHTIQIKFCQNTYFVVNLPYYFFWPRGEQKVREKTRNTKYKKRECQKAYQTEDPADFHPRPPKWRALPCNGATILRRFHRPLRNTRDPGTFPLGVAFSAVRARPFADILRVEGAGCGKSVFTAARANLWGHRVFLWRVPAQPSARRRRGVRVKLRFPWSARDCLRT